MAFPDCGRGTLDISRVAYGSARVHAQSLYVSRGNIGPAFWPWEELLLDRPIFRSLVFSPHLVTFREPVATMRARVVTRRELNVILLQAPASDLDLCRKRPRQARSTVREGAKIVAMQSGLTYALVPVHHVPISLRRTNGIDSCH